jgi:hypothetical protein
MEAPRELGEKVDTRTWASMLQIHELDEDVWISDG